MGCLPLPLIFLLGTGIGYAVSGQTGAVWGAGIGLVVGAVATGIAIAMLRGKR